jgi:hypothetical protein
MVETEALDFSLEATGPLHLPSFICSFICHKCLSQVPVTSACHKCLSQVPVISTCYLIKLCLALDPTFHATSSSHYAVLSMWQAFPSILRAVMTFGCETQISSGVFTTDNTAFQKIWHKDTLPRAMKYGYIAPLTFSPNLDRVTTHNTSWGGGVPWGLALVLRMSDFFGIIIFVTSTCHKYLSQ